MRLPVDEAVKYNKNINSATTLHALILESEYDSPLILKESGNEDFKGIKITDKNNTTRYYLRFSGGHVDLISYNASGVILYNKQLI